MSWNVFGWNFRIMTFGESHGPALGAIVDGVPPGMKLGEKDIQKELDRRRPGGKTLSSSRDEPDRAVGVGEHWVSSIWLRCEAKGPQGRGQESTRIE